MAVDRHDDGADGTNNVKPEQPQWRGRSSGDAPAAPEEPAETRTRAECYEALRAADGKPVSASDSQAAQPDTQGNHASWDAIDVGNRPPLDALCVTPERTKHILDGDANGGGGHRHGVGNPGKTEFPAAGMTRRLWTISSTLRAGLISHRYIRTGTAGGSRAVRETRWRSPW